MLIIGVAGGILILLQLRGKRITVDTDKKIIKSFLSKVAIEHLTEVIVKKIKVNQRVNSRVSSSNVSMYFYKAYLKDGEQKHLISSNRKEKRDLEKLQAIANDLNIDFTKNY